MSAISLRYTRIVWNLNWDVQNLHLLSFKMMTTRVKFPPLMKTLTEFPGMNLKNAAKARQDLITGGKTPEELGPALGEALKLEGERLTILMKALDLIQTRLEDLKRVVVY